MIIGYFLYRYTELNINNILSVVNNKKYRYSSILDFIKRKD